MSGSNPHPELQPGRIWDFIDNHESQKNDKHLLISANGALFNEIGLNGNYSSNISLTATENSLCSAVDSVASSKASEATQMTQLFDVASSTTISSVSTAPIVAAGPQPFPNPQRAFAIIETIRMPCDFFRSTQCRNTFSVDQVVEYVDHMQASHFGNRLPCRLACLFCDDVFESISDSIQDRRECYLDRTEHVVSIHLENGLTERQMRPDYHFLEHAYQCGLITPGMLEDEKQRGELRQIVGIQVNENPVERVPLAQCSVTVAGSRAERRCRGSGGRFGKRPRQ